MADKDGAEAPPQRQPRACAICGKPATAESDPFCSARCANVDLHRWLGGVYAVPAEEGDESDSSLDDEI